MSPAASESRNTSMASGRRASVCSGPNGTSSRTSRLKANAAGSLTRRAMATACSAYTAACCCKPAYRSARARLPSVRARNALSASPSACSTSSRRRTAGAVGSLAAQVVCSNSRAARARFSSDPSLLATSAASWRVSRACGDLPALRCASPSASSSVQCCVSSSGAWRVSAWRAI